MQLLSNLSKNIAMPQQPEIDEFEQNYKEYEEAYLPRSSAQKHPVAIITGGQPGSGKSGLTASAKDDLHDKGGYVLVDADKLRERHPNYTSLMESNDKLAANITHPVASAWSRRLTEVGIDGRRNLIIDQTSRDPEALSKRTEQLRQAGYRVELRVKAVNPLQSEQFIRLRYEDKKVEKGIGRYTPQENHDTTFEGIPNSIERIEQERAVDRVVIYDVNDRQIYENRLINGKWEHKPAGREALEAERSRPFNAIERQKFTQIYEKIIGLMEKRRAPTAEISSVKARWQEAEKQLERLTIQQA